MPGMRRDEAQVGEAATRLCLHAYPGYLSRIPAMDPASRSRLSSWPSPATYSMDSGLKRATLSAPVSPALENTS